MLSGVDDRKRCEHDAVEYHGPGEPKLWREAKKMFPMH